MARYGYARVSTGDQHPEVQQERLTAAECARVFTDTISGTRARRPAWDKLLDLLQPGDELACIRLDRIGRSARHLHNLFGELKDRGVGLICLDQAIDTTRGKGWDDPMAQLLIGVLAILAEFEHRLILERTLDGQASVRRAGSLRRSLGGVPVLGFRERGPGDEPGDDWVLDSPAAAWLAEAAERVLNGEPVDAVHAALPAMHDAAGRPVTAKMLRAALQRPASAGLIADNGGFLPAATAGPLDETTWRRLRALFASRKLGRPIEAGRYPLGPLLRCAKCGNQLTGEQVRPRGGGEPVPYYACANPHKALGVTRPCKGVSVPAEDVHQLACAVVTAWCQTPKVLAATARVPETAGRREELDSQLADLRDWLADLIDKRDRRYITAARYASAEAELTAQIDALAAELDALDEVDAGQGGPVVPFIPGVIEWDELTAKEKRDLLTLAVRTPIIVQPGNGGGAAISAADRVELLPR
jgi:DNA invertase Pin-like site-specific DNA recombinase